MTDRTAETKLIPVILSGGAGTRLWPISRESSPKPFIKLPDGHSLIEKTYARALSPLGVAEVLTVTNRDYYFRCKDEFELAGQADSSCVPAGFLLEPMGRNTAPAIALAALYVRWQHGPDAVMLVLPSDHLISDLSAFNRDVEQASALARAGWLATFGIRPTAPETGFGYLQAGAPIQAGDAAAGLKALRFVEKPDLETAQGYLADGHYFWNGGMFCFTAGAFLETLALTAPDLSRAVNACWDASQAGWDAERRLLEFPAAAFASLPDISVDYAVMEKAGRVAIVPASFDWNDIGSWNSIAELIAPDAQGNRIEGDAVTHNVTNTYLHSETRVIGAIGLDDLMVVDTPDALLVAHRSQVQDIKVLVNQLKARGIEAATQHVTASRPWGTYTVLEGGPRFKIKRIEVKPGAALSLQMHYHRAEHWIVVAGTARVINGDKELLLQTNESTFIPAGHKHRLENPGLLPLVMIEVQSGDYLGEDDIVRFEDIYNRAVLAPT
jgi:mannose-1-phosphate guanylyltransferase/mannose-6-phosphate isomerase